MLVPALQSSYALLGPSERAIVCLSANHRSVESQINTATSIFQIIYKFLAMHHIKALTAIHHISVEHISYYTASEIPLLNYASLYMKLH